MSYAAIEVELREGQLIARGPEPLPRTGEGLLVITSIEQDKGDHENSPSWLSAIDDIRTRQVARGHVSRPAEGVELQMQMERQSWD